MDVSFAIPELGPARKRKPKPITADEAWLLADRLAWYVSRRIPAGLEQLTFTERDDDGTILRERPMNRNEVYDLLMGTTLTPSGDRLARIARNMHTPYEEAERLVAEGRVGSIDELMDDLPEGEPDPLAGYRRRLQAYAQYQQGGM